MKAQSIENLFESPGADQGATSPTGDSSYATVRPDNNSSAVNSPYYSSSVSHQLTTDHRKLAVSSTAINVPMTMGPLRG